MNWSTIGKLVSSFAPALGTLLGGPLGGIAGTLLGSLLGLGSSGNAITPEVVADAINKGGDAIIAQIQSAEHQIVAQWGYLTAAVQADAQQSQAINETIRAEIAGGVSWWHWRNLMGYVVLGQMAAPPPLLIWWLYHGNTGSVQEFITLATALLPYVTIEVALLGYVAADTTRRITTAIVGDHGPSIVDVLTKIIKK